MNQFTVGAAIVALLAPGLGPTTSAAERSSEAARKGPPWISIEHPVNPHDATTRDAFLVVHAYHHGTPTAFPVRGTAEGLVNGQRRTVSLEFGRTSRPGAYSLKKQWRDEGVWTLVISVVQGEGDAAQALVDLAADGTVAAVKVPSRKSADGWTIPAPRSLASIEADLRVRAAAIRAN